MTPSTWYQPDYKGNYFQIGKELLLKIGEQKKKTTANILLIKKQWKFEIKSLKFLVGKLTYFPNALKLRIGQKTKKEINFSFQ